VYSPQHIHRTHGTTFNPPPQEPRSAVQSTPARSGNRARDRSGIWPQSGQIGADSPVFAQQKCALILTLDLISIALKHAPKNPKTALLTKVSGIGYLEL
jgi:hypothetical protein